MPTFEKDEWTSVSEVGQEFNGEVFTFDEYIRVENQYISAILSFMNCNNIDNLVISNHEKDEDGIQPALAPSFLKDDFIQFISRITDGPKISMETSIYCADLF